MYRCKLCGKRETPRKNGYCLKCERRLRDGKIKAPVPKTETGAGGTVKAPSGIDGFADSTRSSQ